MKNRFIKRDLERGKWRRFSKNKKKPGKNTKQAKNKGPNQKENLTKK